MALLLSAVRTRFFDKSNKPLAGGKVYTYEANSTDPKLTWSDTDLSVPNTNPVLLDNEGTAYVYLDGNYRIRVEDKDGVLIEDNPFVQSFFTKFGLPADLVIDKNETQKEINDKTIQEIESINDLINITPRKVGQVVYVKSYYAGKNVGGGYFIYDQSKSTINDGVITFNGWVRQWNNLEIYPEYAGALEGTDCTVQLQKVLDFISPTKFDTSVATMNNSESKLVLVLPSTKLGYTITDTLWIGAGTKIKGSGKLSFKEPYAKLASRIITDFSDPRKPALSSSNWKTDGVRVAFDEMTDGNMYDSGLISHTPDLELIDFNLVTKTGTRGYIGARIQNSPRSKINIGVFGFDYGIVMNASWTSTVDSMALSYKCGLLAQFDNNNCNFDGYYNAKTDQNPLALTNLINFFTSDTGTDTSLNDINKRFGFVSRYAYGASSQNLTCEGNNVNTAICNGDYSISVLYTEKAVDYGLVTFANPTGVIINSYVGSYDSAIFCSGVNSKVIVNSIEKDGTTKDNIFKILNRYNTILQVPLALNAYKSGVTYAEDDGTVYVGTSGNDLNSGKINSQPLLTLNEAFKRVVDKFTFGDKGIKNGSKKMRIVFVSGGDFTLDDTFILNNSVEISSLSSTAPKITFNGHIVLNNVNFSISDCDLVKSNVAGALENSMFWARSGNNSLSINGGNLNILSGGVIYCDFNGSSNTSLLLNNVSTIGTSVSQLIQGNYNDTSPHIINVVRSKGAISSDIIGRPDKGISVPVSWQNKILGL
ncbi:hypothetical protein OHV48_05950 [Acinetobacter baumannii]|nr:hypothetical protein [Acinetobacter baumannii]